MSDLTIEKDRLNVVIHFTDGSRTRGEIFLAAFSSNHHGHQKVGDLLEEEKPFFPIVVDNKVEFAAKNQVLMIEGELVTEEDKDMYIAGLLHEEEVSIIITDSYIINGTLLAEVPPEKSRLSDCINLPENFLNMKSEGRYLHINKWFIKKVLSLAS